MINNYKKYLVNYKLQKIGIVVSVIIIGVGICSVVKNLYRGNIKNIFVGVMILLFGLWVIYINVDGIKQHNKIILILGGEPYLFDYHKELKVYKKIGVALNNDDAKSFEKYTQWKEYVQKKYSNLKNNEDFYRFLNKKLRIIKQAKEVTKNIILPLELVVPQIAYDTSKSIIDVCICFVAITVLFINVLMKIDDSINFFEDYMELILLNNQK